MTRSGILATLVGGLVCSLFMGATHGQECPQQSVQIPAPAPAPAAVPVTPSFESPVAASAGIRPITIGQLRALRNSTQSSSFGSNYFQALSAMAPVNLQGDLVAQQALVIQQNQARMARRSALREPARQRMREENAHRFFEAGSRAEAQGQYAKARQYYRRSIRIGAGDSSQMAQDALSQITGGNQ